MTRKVHFSIAVPKDETTIFDQPFVAFLLTPMFAPDRLLFEDRFSALGTFAARINDALAEIRISDVDPVTARHVSAARSATAELASAVQVVWAVMTSSQFVERVTCRGPIQ